MTNEAIDAIKGSIVKWEKILDGSGIDKGRGNCPLCTSFYDRGCIGCPIRDKTGMGNCRNTPIQVWRGLTKAHFIEGETRYFPESLIAMDICKTVIQFLKNLLPQ